MPHGFLGRTDGNLLWASTSGLTSSPSTSRTPNARPEPRPEAGAQRTLEGVGSRPSFGMRLGTDSHLAFPYPRGVCKGDTMIRPRPLVSLQNRNVAATGCNGSVRRHGYHGGTTFHLCLPSLISLLTD